MSIFFFAARHSSRCEGFRIASVSSRHVIRHRNSEWSSHLLRAETSRFSPLCVRPQRSFTRTASKALYSTAGEEITEAKIDDDETDTSLLYQQFKDLSLEIQKHDEVYYGGDNITKTESISDDEFDALVRREEELERNYPHLLQAWQLESGLGKAATRSGRVGKATSTNGRAKRKHLTPMLSLDNVHNDDQLQSWLKKVVKATIEADDDPPSSMVTIVTEPKLDGVSLSLRYESLSITSGNPIPLELKWASTRGDGTVGQDVTAAAKQMTGIPDTIHLKASSTSKEEIVLEVRGEVVLPRSAFLKLQQQASEAAALGGEENDDTNSTEVTETKNATIVSFSNPRNAASGILLRKESDDMEERTASEKLRSLLRFYAYDLDGLEGDDTEADGIKLREQLSEWDFPLAMPIAITNLEWQNDQHDTSTSDTESAAESKAMWDDWFEKTIVQDQISPVLEYFSALEEHRERLQDEDNNNKNSTLLTNKKMTASYYDWGDFDMDGCVHKVTQASIRSSMGYTTKSPKWATAHKFPAQSSVARLLDIIVQVGRTGAITPVAILEPTEVGGVTVQRATLHNFGHLQEIMGFEESDENGVTAKIPKYEPLLVQRAGDVIPQVVRRIKSSQLTPEDSSETEWISLDPPDKCPFCSSPVTYDTISQSSSSVVGQVVRCSGPPLLCPPRAVTSLKHAFSRDAMDLTGLSEARIQQLMDADLLKFPSDIFTMDNAQWESVEALSGWGKRSSQNLRYSSEQVASRGISLGRFIYSLGIRHLGKHTSELVASCYGSSGAFLKALGSASRQQITEADDSPKDESEDEDINNRPFPELTNKLGIGPVAIDSLFAFSKSRELVDAAKTLAESLNILEQEVFLEGDEETSSLGATSSSDQPWKGFRVVFTGSLGIVEGLTRSKAQEIAKQLGATATPGSVSKSTDLVVFGDKGGKKLTQARDLGIDTMEAERFVKLANANGFLNVDDR